MITTNCANQYLKQIMLINPYKKLCWSMVAQSAWPVLVRSPFVLFWHPCWLLLCLRMAHWLHPFVFLNTLNTLNTLKTFNTMNTLKTLNILITPYIFCHIFAKKRPISLFEVEIHPITFPDQILANEIKYYCVLSIYRTRVRSLFTLVTNWLTESLIPV